MERMVKCPLPKKSTYSKIEKMGGRLIPPHKKKSFEKNPVILWVIFLIYHYPWLVPIISIQYFVE
jgi:hypothetical protein